MKTISLDRLVLVPAVHTEVCDYSEEPVHIIGCMGNSEKGFLQKWSPHTQLEMTQWDGHGFVGVCLKRCIKKSLVFLIHTLVSKILILQ